MTNKLELDNYFPTIYWHNEQRKIESVCGYEFVHEEIDAILLSGWDVCVQPRDLILFPPTDSEHSWHCYEVCPKLLEGDNFEAKPGMQFDKNKCLISEWREGTNGFVNTLVYVRRVRLG